MRPKELLKLNRKQPDFMGKATRFMAILLFMSLFAWADIYKKVDKLGRECREGNEEACAELSEIARNDKDGNVRLAAAARLKDKSLAQVIYANIAKYDKDGTVREAAVKKLTDLDLLANLAKYGKDSAVRLAAERKLSGQDLPDGDVENAEDETLSKEAEPAIPAAARGPRREGSGKKMGLYTYELPTIRNQIGIGFMGILEAEGNNAKMRGAMPYFAKLRLEFIKVAEDVLKENDIFQFVPTEKLEYMQADKLIPAEIFVQKNDLHASLSVKIVSWGGNIAIKKKMTMKMHWEIKNSSGYEVEIKTYCKSKDRYGLFPDPADPELEPVLVELARENALQFLEKLAQVIEEDKKLL